MSIYDYHAFTAYIEDFFNRSETERLARINELQAEVSRLIASNSALTSDNETLTGAVAELNATIDELEKEIERLKQNESPWEPVYSTKFEANDGWTLKNERQNNDASRNLPKNAVFKNDGLHILGLRERVGEGDKMREYTTADILGYHAVVSNYFRARVVASSPHARGIWPCPLWFRPGNHSDGEIDIMENFGGQPYAKATLHSEYSNRKMIGKTLPWPKAPDAYYEYVIEKTPGRILITMDGQTLMDVGPHTSSVFPWDRIFENPERTWYPRITLQIGCGVDNPNCSTGFPDSSFQRTEMHIKELELWNYKG